LKPLNSVQRSGTTTDAAPTAMIARATNALTPLATAALAARES